MLRSVFAVVLVGLQVAIAGAQRDTDVAAPRCKDVQKLMNSADSVLLDVKTLASVKSDVQHVLDCLPRGGSIQLDVPELELGATLLIRRSISIAGLPTSIRCVDENKRPVIDIRSDDVVLAGLSLARCNLSSTSGLIKVKGSQNVTLKHVVFENNANTDGPACLSAIKSNIDIQNITAMSNTGMNGGAMSFTKASQVAIVDSFFKHNHASEQGGALYIHNSNCSISNSRFVANNAFDDGGALLAKGDTESKVNIKNVEFHGNGEYKNSSHNRQGGAIALFGPKLSAEVSGATFVNNSAPFGGAIRASNVTKVAIHDSTFTKSSAFHGGALYIQTSFPKMTILQVERCSFARNSAHGTREGLSSLGGAVTIFENGTEAAFKDCSFFRNKAGVYGGALFAVGTRKVKVSGCDFFGNKAGNTSLSGTEESCSIPEDSPGTFGGAIHLWSVPEIFVAQSNFTRNCAKNGGAVDVHVRKTDGCWTKHKYCSESRGPCIRWNNDDSRKSPENISSKHY